MNNLTSHQKYYYAWDLSHKKSISDDTRFTGILSEAKVDLNPHQVDAALFAFKSPLSHGAILADEVGLGKTIEAGLIISQFWAECKRHILIIVPASLRSQWNDELYQKFYIPSIIMEKVCYSAYKHVQDNPFRQDEYGAVICSYQFASKHSEEIASVSWDLVVIDEAHKLRNVYKKSNVMANTLRKSLQPFKKILLTATPLQNSLKELYGLISIVDTDFFSTSEVFSERYNFTTTRDSSRYGELKERLAPIVHRTLRNQVQEYVNYTKRIAIIQDFYPNDKEKELYSKLNSYMQRPNTYGLPPKQKELLTLILRKIMASSSYALSYTLEKMICRLQDLKKDPNAARRFSTMFEDYDIFDDDELAFDEDSNSDSISTLSLENEITELKGYQALARSIGTESKAKALKEALRIGFSKINDVGASRKALIFTESRRTQEYLRSFLAKEGLKVVCFNGMNNDEEAKAIYKAWLIQNAGTSKITGNTLIDRKQSIIDYFRSSADILIATEAGSEGINLQFCSIVINYDLPWNPQRIEQRIGRCHRYGQKHDVVVVNFINQENQAEKRIYELLSQKFNLFDGVFGCSDEILGSLESGFDFERRLNSIFQSCRTSKEIQEAFDVLQSELEELIEQRINHTKKSLLENFDDEVVAKLKIRQTNDSISISTYERHLWLLALSILGSNIDNVDYENHSFYLRKEMIGGILPGSYWLNKNADANFQLRISHPLGKAIITQGLSTPLNDLSTTLLYTRNRHIGLLDKYIGCHGTAIAYHLSSENAYDNREDIIFCVIDDKGNKLPGEMGSKLMELESIKTENCSVSSSSLSVLDDIFTEELKEYSNKIESENSDYINIEIDKNDALTEEKLTPIWDEVVTLRKELDAVKRQLRKERNPKLKISLSEQRIKLDKEITKKQAEYYNQKDRCDQETERLLQKLQKAMESRVSSKVLFKFQWNIIAQ